MVLLCLVVVACFIYCLYLRAKVDFINGLVEIKKHCGDGKPDVEMEGSSYIEPCFWGTRYYLIVIDISQ